MEARISATELARRLGDVLGRVPTDGEIFGLIVMDAIAAWCEKRGRGHGPAQEALMTPRRVLMVAMPCAEIVHAHRSEHREPRPGAARSSTPDDHVNS